ncbi:MAG: hypothetical protein J0M08_12825 [Bacteroidetes bacterium]|nr:hypothetical protein [Bacteroidota bacterium]
MAASTSYIHKPKVSNRAFWDVNYNSIDYNKHADYVIKKVFDLGTLDDIMEVLVCYGEEKVKDVIINADRLDSGAIEMAYIIFDVKPLDLKCYTKK